MGCRKVPAQRDLFTMMTPTTTVPPEVLRSVVPLLEQLLAEVMTGGRDAMEGADEQDQA